MGKCDCDWCNPGPYRDFKDGAVDEEYGEVEVNYTPRRKNKKVHKKKPGCPANEGKSHIYIYTTEFNMEDVFFKYYGFHKWEHSVCCGCGKKARKSRKTERYEKKFGNKMRQHRWTDAEYEDEGYAEFRKKWVVQRGCTPELYGNRYLGW